MSTGHVTVGTGSFPYQITDPLGCSVQLSLDAWEHIVQDPSRQVISVDQVLATVQQLATIRKDKTFSHRRCYYQFTTVLSVPIAAYLKVVVDFSTDPARSITAFPTNRIHQGEEQLWP